jgi:transposase
MMNINQAVDEVRRSQWREADKSERKLLKGHRFILLANNESLDSKGQDRLSELLDHNQNISTAYLLKEQFRVIFNYKMQSWAEKALTNWCGLAEASELPSFKRLAKGFRKHMKRVCGFVKHGLTSGLIEWFNNQIARIVHRACGIRDLEYLELKLRHKTIMRI